ncbi:MAG: hypothetical protein M1834_004516 [Cirrosporium novae-zelandiae]|nr:MAG: hypothetical protein M1834_004516 [Cirrosporium novae-zelandiae]
MPFFKKSLAGPGYIILNVIRVMNIIALLTVVAASAVMLVKTFVVSKFFFFDACSHIITASLATFLILSEISLFRGYFERNWPLYSISSGLVALGLTMVSLGVLILGNLNKQATSQKSLGLPFWRIVISSGIIVSVLGIANIFASYIFRDNKMGIPVTARQVRSYGAEATQKVCSTPSSPRRSFLLRRANTSATLPSYSSSETRQQPPRLPLQISRPMNTNQEQFAKFEKSPEAYAPKTPDLAYHPANMV